MATSDAGNASAETHPARLKWNQKFAEGDFQPFPAGMHARWLAENRTLIESRAPGRALDVACGNGRNALFLAELGFEVDAVDISDYAIERLSSAATERGLPITPRLQDLESGSLPRGAYDVVVNINYLQRDLFEDIANALRPRGVLVFETVARIHIDELGERFNPEYVLENNELLRAFGRLFVRHYREGATAVDRPGESPSGMASLVAERSD